MLVSITNVLWAERPAAAACLSLTSHYFYDLIRSTINPNQASSFKNLFRTRERCVKCKLKSYRVDWWSNWIKISDTGSEFFGERKRPHRRLQQELVKILQDRRDHYHYDRKELMKLLRREDFERGNRFTKWKIALEYDSEER